jgi:stage V sporulation protein R
MVTSEGPAQPLQAGDRAVPHIEDRWNKGQFGKEYDDCDDMAERAHWNRRLGLGRQKMFEVRKHSTTT